MSRGRTTVSNIEAAQSERGNRLSAGEAFSLRAVFCSTRAAALAVWLLAASMCHAIVPQWAQENRPPERPLLRLDDFVPAFSVENVDLPTAVKFLSNEYGLRCGIESVYWGLDYADKPLPRRFSLALRGITAREVLNSLVRMDPRYIWTADEDFANVVLADAYRARNYPLNATLPIFQAEGLPYAMAFQRLFTSPEVLTLHARGGLRHAINAGPRVTIHAAGATAREILNEIARQSNMSWWISGDDLPRPGMQAGFIMTSKFPLPKGRCGDSVPD